MSKEDFDAYFASLEKSSERARSIIYIFTIASIAVLFFLIDTFVYPSRQFTFDFIKTEVECRYRPNHWCTDRKLSPPIVQEPNSPPPLEEATERELWQHLLTKFYDDSLSLRTFDYSVLGITADRDLAWLIFPFFGIIEYYLIWLALARARSLFSFLAEQNKSDATRLRLMLSTQLLTSPLNDELMEEELSHSIETQGNA